MPEEINRVMADHCSDQLFAPTEKCKKTLLREGISGSKIHVTGNTIVDAIYQNLKLAKEKNTLEGLEITPDEYFLVTAHRQENVDDRVRFAGLLKGVEELGMEFNIPVIYPIHPRSKKMAKDVWYSAY
jgi:UDP-N-acetylglucosamine 2-epimerase (non-hydrolysing)